MARGLDIGTCFLVAAKQDPNASTDGEVKSVRDAFLDIDNDASVRNMMKMSKVGFVESEDTLYVIGDPALRMANMFKKEVKRPLKAGVINPGEKEAERILMLLLKEILGDPEVENEVCYYSVPAKSVDADMDVIYHEAMFKKIVGKLGFQAESMNEAAAVVYSNCAAEGFTALATSHGAGMTNTSLLYQTMIGMEFSFSKGGDWIDQGAARAVGKTASQIMAIKEKGINLLDPTDGDPKYENDREAIIVYYKNLVKYVVEHIKKEFSKTDGSIEISDPIPWILSGGTSQPKNFLEFFKGEIDKYKDFPIPISEIRMANDPLNDVAKGLLIAAINATD